MQTTSSAAISTGNIWDHFGQISSSFQAPAYGVFTEVNHELILNDTLHFQPLFIWLLEFISFVQFFKC